MSLITQSDDRALEALRRVDFDWCVCLKDMWQDNATDVESLHAPQRQSLVEHLRGLLAQQTSPFSLPMLGDGGAGKTHLLNYLRQQTLQTNATFVLVDMTDVREFWVTTLQGYLDSLQHRMGDRDQQSLILDRFLSKFFTGSVEETRQKLKGYTPAKLKKNISRIIAGLAQRCDRPSVLRHQDVIRAICCLNSDDFETQSIGLTWLQGQELDVEQKQRFGFLKTSETCRQIVQALSWYISLTGPTVVAFDQLDPIVHQIRHQSDNLAREQETAVNIVRDIGNGFASMRELAWTLPVISCIETTWAQLNETVMSSLRDRFQRPLRLQRPEGSFARRMITGRLKSAYDAIGFAAPFDTWPFRPEALDEFEANTPRAVLKACYEACRGMLTQQQVREVTSLRRTAVQTIEPVDVTPLQEQFEHLRIATSVPEYTDEKKEDQQLAPLLVTAMRALLIERSDDIPDNVTPIIDEQFAGNGNALPLHARLRLVFHDENEREEHYSVRALERTNAAAFQSRLKAAINHSGISPHLSFRHLTLIRSKPVPRGKVTTSLLEAFADAGGRLHSITKEQLKVLVAVNIMFDAKDPLLDAWLQQRRPISSLSDLADCLFHRSFPPTTPPPSENEEPRDTTPPVGGQVTGTGTGTDTHTHTHTHTHTKSAMLPIGTIVDRTDDDARVHLPLINLAKHTMIMGASGSGKSVTVRRLLEGAALAGIPAVIIDGAGDMCSFDQQRSAPSPHWLDGDQENAGRFHAETEQIIYTPGARGGRPLSLSLIPDFVPLRQDEELLQATVDMVAATMKDLAATGTKVKAAKKAAILSRALAAFARTAKRTTLSSFIDFLADLPPNARMNIRREDDLAHEMVDSLKIQQVQNPLLKNGGDTLEPTRLFGRTATGKTPITTISLVGLPEESQRTTFLSQLAMLLFRWVKANPTPTDNRPLHGLLVIDEAADFIPSSKATACKESMRTLAAQARKYGLGIVLATQHPKGVDKTIVANCGTQFYGRMGSPAAIGAAEEILRALNVRQPHVAGLPAGQFWMHSADGEQHSARLLQLPESLSLPTTLGPEEILSRAKRDA